MIDPCIFTAFPLNPADHHRGDDLWLSERLEDKSSRFILYAKGRPLMDISDGLKPAYKTTDDIHDMTAGDVTKADWIFIGLADEIAYFAVSLPSKLILKSSEKFIDLRSLALQLSVEGFSDIPALLARGKMLLDWNGRRHFCSCCGHKTTSEQGGYIRKCSDEACQAEHFPRTDPVVIMMVTSGDKCLLGRGKGWPAGQYSALAGFMEPGETIEEATRREVFEESGIRIGDVTYVKSQPWPFPSSLMIGVRAEAVTTRITLDPHELEAADWFDKSYLQEMFETGGDNSFRIPPKIAIARHLLEDWLQQN